MSAHVLLAAVRDAIRRRFAVDTRALAAFRIALAAVVLLDLCLRARSLTAFYTDAGVLPRADLHALYPVLSQFSLHALSGAAWVQVAFFVVAAGFALAFLVGYHTRLAAAGTLLLTVSLQLRNPLVLNAGDTLLRQLLLWSVLLPLGSRWAVDAVRTRPQRARVVSVATALLLVQPVLVYGTNALFKHRGALWMEGSAVRYVFSLKQFTVLLGPWLADHPLLLTAADWGWVALVSCAPLLLVLTGRARAALAGCFVAAHLAMLGTLRLGVFPLVAAVALLPFFPASVWSWLERRTRARWLGARWETLAARLDTCLPRRTLPHHRVLDRSLPRLVTAVFAVVLVVLVLSNAASVGLVPASGAEAAGVDPARFGWGMFAPDPPQVDVWFAAPATLVTGERVDALTGDAVASRPPDDLTERYPSARWRKYFERLRLRGDPDLARQFAGYRCARWNATHEHGLTRIAVTVVEQRTRFDGPEPTSRHTLWNRTCAAATAP